MMEPGRLFGKYRILRTIGAGGFARVYLGEHRYLKTKAAIKVLHVGPSFTSNDLEGFMTEARIIAQLKHPHIINILDFDIEKDAPYLIMGYAPKGSLLSRHSAGSILEPPLILSYVRQIAAALQFAHDHQVVHCDVKPENVLLGADDEILLADFGIAVIAHHPFKTQQQIMGTMHYMSPEQFAGKPVAASDQYALAVLTYRWLCGRVPFMGNSLSLQMQHNTVPPPSLCAINPRVSRDIESVVLTALEKDARRRFASITAFADALENVCHSRRSIPPAIEQQAEPQVHSPVQAPQTILEPSVLPPSIISLLPLADPEQPADPLPLHLPSPSGSAHRPAITTHTLPPAVPTPAPVDMEFPHHPPIQIPDKNFRLLPEEHVPQAIPRAVPIPLFLPQESDPLELAHVAKETGVLTYTHHTSWVSTVAWSQQGKWLASGSWDNTVRVWDATTGEHVCTYRDHRQPVKSVAWTPDGASIASGSWDNTIRVWNAATGTQLFDEYSQEAQVETVAWSPDGNYLASAGHDGIVHVRPITSQNSITRYKNHRGPVWAVSWSPDSRRIASASHDGTVQIWEARTGKHRMTYDEHQRRVAAVAWSPDGALIASGDYDGTVRIWDSVRGQTSVCYRDEAGAVKALAWSPNGESLASAVKLIHVRTIQRGHLNASVLRCTYTGHTSWINALAWSPDGQTIASASDDKTVHVWKVTG